MAINITALGGSGVHTLQKVNVNLEENYIYYAKRDSGTAFPTALTDDSAWVYREGTGSITGLTDETVYYVNTDAYSVSFASSAGGSNIALSDYVPGTITLNYPNVFQNTFNISSVKFADQQAVKYLTDSTAITGLVSGNVYYVKNQLTGLGGSSLYQFTDHDFTTAGVTGRTGPTIEQLRSSYSATTWKNTYLNQGTFQGYQDWTVPEDGVYEFNVKGAPGRQGRTLGGGGAIVRGRVRLTKGEIITFVPGQRGELPTAATTYPGSSGASWVIRKSGNIPLFVAGGGSSSSNVTVGINAVTTNNGGTSSTGQLGGTSGNGAPQRVIAGGGGGFLSAGSNGSTSGVGGGGFNNGLVGGLAPNTSSGSGGFGGGGSASGTEGSSGGAGGYSGGAGNTNTANSVGGSGGSFIFPTATNLATSNGLYNGATTLLGTPITNLNLFNTGEVEGSVTVTLVERSVFGFKLHDTPTDAVGDLDAIAVEPNGSSYHSLVPVTLDIDNDIINSITPHGWSEGEGVNHFYTGTPAGGLSNTGVYYIDRIDDYRYRLSLTPDPNFTTVNITTPSNASTQGLRRVIVNTATNTITINNHGFLVDQPVRYSSGGGTAILPLQNNATYYIKEVVDANRFTLTQSLQGTVIDLTTVGTGTNHSFILTVVNDLEDTLYIPTHGYVSGQTVKYQKARDFVITSFTSSGTTRTINTAEPHGFQVNSRVTIDGLTRPTISAPAIAITRVASSAQVRTLTLGSTHSYTAGMLIQVTGLTGTFASRFNGIHVVTAVPTSNTLTYNAEESVTVSEAILSGNDLASRVTRRPDLELLDHTRGLTVRSIASSGTTRTIVTNEPHYYSTGTPVWIQGISGSPTGTGIQDDIGEYFNGIYFVASAPSSNTFTYVAAHEGTPSNLDPSITFTTVAVGTSGVNAGGTVYREQILTAVTSTSFSYVMPHSSLTVGSAETITGRTSKIGVRINNRNLTVGTLANLTTDVNHDLQVGDRFTVKSLNNSNQNVFNGTYRVLTAPSGTTINYTVDEKTEAVASRRLLSSTTAIVNTVNPHDFIAGNFVSLVSNSGNDGSFWNNEVDIASRESSGTTRTINTNTPHNLTTGERFEIVSMTGLQASDFTGQYVVASAPSTTSLTYVGTTSQSLSLTTVTGILRKSYAIASIPSFTVSSRVRAGNVVTIVTTANHDLLVGEKVRINNIGGASPEVFNGEYVITATPAANSFTYTTATTGTVALASVGGTITAVNQFRYTSSTHVRNVTNRALLSHTIGTITTSFPHYLEVGSTVTIDVTSGTSQPIFDGTRVIASVPTPTTLTFTRAPEANVTTFTVTNRSRTVNVCDVTFNTTHNLKVGDSITISNITGTDPAIFNGTHVITSLPATNRVTFFSLSSGTITTAAVSGNIQVEAIAAESVSGTVTLNTIPLQTATSGTVKLREVPAVSSIGELITDSEIPGLSNQAVYYTQRVDANTVRLFTNINLTTSTDITGVGLGTHSLVTFSVNYDDNTITIPNNGFSLGELVEYDTVGQTAIGGITSGTPYYIVPINGNTFKLATTAENASSGTTVDLTTATTAVGRHKLKSLIRTPDGTYTITNISSPTTFEVAANGSVPVITKTFDPRTSVDLTQNIIKVVSHGFNTGTEITYSNGGGTDLSGLVDDTHYYVIVINKDWIKLAETQIDANSGVPLTLASFGAGVSHSLTSSQINGQITGTGTVTTTSGSVLVSGSGTAFSKILKVGDKFRIFPPDTTQSSFFASTDVTTGTDVITLAAHPYATGDSVVFSPGTGGPRRGIFSIASNAGTTRTIKLRESHPYIIGNTLTISGLTGPNASEFTGTYVLTAVDNTAGVFSITYTHPNSLATAITEELTTSGVVQSTGAGGVAPNPLVSGYYYFVRSLAAPSTSSLTARQRDLNVILFTTSAAHNLRAGNTVTISSISGVNPELFNGTFTVTQVPTATTFKVTSSTSGTVSTATVTGTVTPNSSNTITLHNLQSDAIAGTSAIDLTTQGSGSALALTKTIPSTPIIREIAAIGGDNQITVDRGYSTTYTGVNFSYPTFVYVRPQGYSLHRPFDGGVEMSTGFGTWYGSIIRQTRKYFRYQSGKGIQTSAGINFKPSIDIESMTRVGTSSVVAVRTRRPHGLINGLFVRTDDAETSQGVTSTVYNGTFQVTVIDSFNFTFIATQPIVESSAYGFPRLHVTAWENGALRAGMFDDQNGMFFEFDGQKIWAVRRSSTQQIAGTCAALQGSEFVFGTNTNFSAQLVVGDKIVLRGQSYRVTSITGTSRMSIKPEYKGNSGNEKEFIPGDGTTGVVKVATNIFNIINHGFSNNLPLEYNAIDGSPIGGLINGRTYYVSVIDNNNFWLKANPDATQTVTLSNAGTGSPHSFTPAKTGIIATLTVDTRTPQEQWSVDPVDGLGVTGYDLDLSKIQMIYMDYSWYGAGKIRYGFKTVDGQVRYVHEYVHNNLKYESYFRSGNLPARYEVATGANPTYIPSLFHWGTSVIMDGKFDDDRAYLFSKSSSSLNIGGTTAKSFGSTAINPLNDIITIPSHGFATGDALQFTSTAPNGQPQANTQNPTLQIVAGINADANLTNERIYYVRALTANSVVLFPSAATAANTAFSISNRVKAGGIVTLTTTAAHGFSVGDSIFVNLPATDVGATSINGVFQCISGTTGSTVVYNAAGQNFQNIGTGAPIGASIVIKGAINITSAGTGTGTYTFTPAGSLNNSSGTNYQPLISIRLSPSVSEGLTGALGDRDIINRMQLRLNEVGLQTNQLVDVKLLLNGRLNNLNFQAIDVPSLVQTIEHTSNDTISGGVQVYNFRANGNNGVEQTTLVDISQLFELSNSILGGNSTYPDGPDIMTVAVARLTGTETLASAKLSWAEAQA
jgi:hypothetical protein